MQTETTKLIIHTGAGPDAAREEAKREGPKKARASKVKAGEVVVWGLVQENEADGLGEKAKERTADAGRKARERSARRERAAALRRARIGKFLSSRPRSEEGRDAPCSGALRPTGKDRGTAQGAHRQTPESAARREPRCGLFRRGAASEQSGGLGGDRRRQRYRLRSFFGGGKRERERIATREALSWAL